jgi:hypothetical protein
MLLGNAEVVGIGIAHGKHKRHGSYTKERA